MTLSNLFRPAVVIFCVATSALLLGCDSNVTEPERNAEVVELNLETLEAETEYGTLEAERIDDSYVTALGEGQAIGIVLPDGEGDPDQDVGGSSTPSPGEEWALYGVFRQLPPEGILREDWGLSESHISELEDQEVYLNAVTAEPADAAASQN